MIYEWVRLPTRMKTALFLGAGASVFVSHPTTLKLLSDVKSQVQTLPVKDHIRQYITDILESNNFGDVEELSECIDQIIAIDNTRCRLIIEEMRHTSKNITYPEMVDALTKLKDKIRDILFDSFTIKLENFGAIKEVYDRLWSVIKNNGSDTFQVITTNYDQVIEQYCSEADWEPVNGFDRSKITLRGYWKDKWDSADKPLYLVKLHGSISWHNESHSGKIVELGGLGRRDAAHDVFIWPTTGPKEYNMVPFHRLIKRFKEMLSDVDMLVVVGFSYRDPAVNKIIRNRVNEGMILVSVSPTAAEDIVRNYIMVNQADKLTSKGLQFIRFGNHVYAHEKEFGPDTIGSICDALNLIYQWHKSDKNDAHK